MAALRRDFLPPDLEPLLADAGIEACLAVQVRQSLEETSFLLDLADRTPQVGGVVGWLDLRATDVEEQLDRFARRDALRGLRHIAQAEPDAGFLERPGFVRGVATLRDRGLVYELLVFPHQLPAAIGLARALPDQPFVLDHIAKPPIAAGGPLEPWAGRVRELAACENVACKVSGLVTEANWSAWHARDFRPWFEVVLEAFGPQRLLFGSDWPVCTVAGSYPQVLGLAEELSEPLSSGERAAFFGGNTARVYGLG
jgi:L-fuconolactonase